MLPIAHLTRHADPPHGADGRFYSSGSNAEETEHPKAPPDIRQCAHCGVIQSHWSSLYGQHFPNEFAPNITHGTCSSCDRKYLEKEFVPRLMRIKGLSRADALAHIEAMVQLNMAADSEREAWDATRLANYQRDHPDYQARARIADLQQRVAALRRRLQQMA